MQLVEETIVLYAFGIQKPIKILFPDSSAAEAYFAIMAKANGFEYGWQWYESEDKKTTIEVFCRDDEASWKLPKYLIVFNPNGLDTDYIIAHTLIDFCEVIKKLGDVFGKFTETEDDPKWASDMSLAKDIKPQTLEYLASLEQ